MEFEVVQPVTQDRDSTDDELPAPKRRRGVGKEWHVDKTFPDKNAAIAFVKDDWAIAYTHATMSGSKVYYRCKHAARCPAEMHLAYSADCDQVSLNLTSKEHDHAQEETSQETHRGIHPQTREVINSLFIDGVRKPKAIFAALRNRKCSHMRSKVQMANYLVSLRNKHLGKPTISLGELSAWAEARKMVPDDDDQAFVCGFDCSYGQRKKESAFFRVSISTKRLLKLGSRSSNIHADATYKLIWQGYPVLITGYSDANRKFHPISLAITMNEAKEDYHFIFAAVANGVSMIYPDDHPGFAPTHLICDAAPAIKNGYTSAFGHEPEKTISCWAHVVMNMDKQIVRVRDKETRAAIREDIFELQLCPDEDSFQHAAALFLTKWESSDKDGVASFLEYFQGSWLQRNYTWFEGYAPGFPSTNNGLEALNMIIKRQHTFRERHDLGRFLSIVEHDIVLTWSRDRDDSQAGHTEVASQPMRTLACWTSAYQWAGSEAESLKSGQNVYVSSHSLTNTDLKTSVILQKECFQRASWASFDEYKDSRNSVWHLVQQEDNSFSCNCPANIKANICKHSLGIEIRLGISEPPSEAKTVPLGMKRKRGRPKLSKPALLRQ